MSRTRQRRVVIARMIFEPNSNYPSLTRPAHSAFLISLSHLSEGRRRFGQHFEFFGASRFRVNAHERFGS